MDDPLAFTLNHSIRREGTLDQWSGCFGRAANDENTKYFPAPKQFQLTKEFAESGQSKIKQTSQSYKIGLSKLKIEENCNLENMKSYKKGGSNYSKDDNEINKINMLYFKARYEYASFYVSRCSKTISSIVKILKVQHTIAIRTYIQFVSVIRRYVLKETPEKESK